MLGNISLQFTVYIIYTAYAMNGYLYFNNDKLHFSAVLYNTNNTKETKKKTHTKMKKRLSSKYSVFSIYNIHTSMYFRADTNRKQT